MLATRLAQALDALRLMHVSVNPSGRHHEALRHLEAFERDGLFGIEVAEAKHLAEETVLIVAAAYGCRRLDTPFSPDKLKQMLDDPLIPAGPQSAGRDVQFELLLAAMFHLGGADVVAGEPDLQIAYRGERFGVAAKRLTSLNANTLRTRVREAVRQIDRSDLSGWIALNLDTRFPSPQGVDDKALLRIASEEFDAVGSEIVDQRWDREWVRGMILHGSTAEWTPSAGGHAQRHKMASFQRWLALTDDTTTERVARDFMSSLYGALEAKLREIWSEDYAWRT